MIPEHDVKSGRQLGAFSLTRQLGRGGFKTVYEAVNTAPEENAYPETVAVCVPHAQDEEARRLVTNEFRVVQTLDHPAIVQEYGMHEEDGLIFIVMERVEGRPLNELLRADGTFPLSRAVEIVRQVGEALDYAHEGLAIHRDIKPANIMLRPDGSVKVLDFGLARLMSHSQYKASTRVGSVAYMAPEQFEGTTGMNADLWSLGVTFFQMITNVLPFDANDEAYFVKQILYDEPDLDPIEQGDFDSRLVRVFRKILEKAPEKRYRTAAELVADLDAVLRHAATVNSVEGEIEVHLRAHFPLLRIHTFEEERVLESLHRVREAMAVDQPIELFVWSETRGLRNREGKPVHPRTAGDPILALQHVIESDAQGIYVFLDIHRHFAPVVNRLVRDAIWTVKRKRKSLVFVGPVSNIPEELSGDATFFAYPPPELAELQELVDEVAESATSDPGGGGEGELKAVVPPEDREMLARAVLGLTRREAERALRRAGLRHGGLSGECLTDVVAQKEQIVRKEGLLEFCREGLTFDDVGGLDGLKAWFGCRRQAFSPEGRRFGLRVPRGVVLVGIPGCGKSLSAKALASDWGVPLLRLDVGRLRGRFVGQSEANLRRALATAEHVAPCILWIDELEKAFSGLGQSGDSGVSQRMFGSFLTWLEEHAAPVFVAATANDISRLPMEFARGGRFDERFFVGLPGEDERRAIFDIHFRKRRRDPDGFEVDRLVDESDGFSGAEIEEAVVSGLYRAFNEDRDLSTEDVLYALGDTVPLSRSRSDELARLEQWAAVNARPAQRRG